MIILGIETSCDETGAALVEGTASTPPFKTLSNSIATSLALHAQTGGIIPEIAAREQVKYILPVISDALHKGLSFSLDNAKPGEAPPIDAIAVTYGPGLIGSLLVGIETAKTLSLLWQKPLIPVNHLYGHLYANFLEEKAKAIQFPLLALIVSGGHTDLVLLKSHEDIAVIGGTRDDAAGEAFDKIGRLLNLPYPAGPVISNLAKKGDRKAFHLPRPMIGSGDFDFSFSGLKTAVLNLSKKEQWNFEDDSFSAQNQQLLSDICASVEMAIVDVLNKKTIAAAKKYSVRSVVLGGGVAANELLKTTLEKTVAEQLDGVSFHVPPREYCTDNAAMIAAAGFFAKSSPPLEITARPELYF